MSSSLIPFSFGSHEVRAFNIDGNPWFVGKDVAEVLGYKDTVNALKQHCKGVAKYHPIVDTLGRTQEVRIINEPDTYRLISGSTLPEAVRFEAWLFEEVLPSIRKTGSYSLPGAQPTDLDALIAKHINRLFGNKVLVDHDTLANLTRLQWAVQKLAEPLIPLALKLEQQCGKPLIQDQIAGLAALEKSEQQEINKNHLHCVEQIIKDAGTGGIVLTDLHNKTRFLTKAIRDAIRQKLRQQGQIIEQREASQGTGDRPVTRLIHAAFAGLHGVNGVNGVNGK